VEAKLEASQNQPRDQRNQQLVELLRGRPGVAEAAINPDGSVWARFTDNRYYIINDTLIPESRSKSAAAPPVSPGETIASLPGVERTPSRALRAAGSVELPDSTNAYLLTGVLDERELLLEPLDNPPNPDLQKMLNKKEYHVIRSKASVDILKTIRNAGVLHISTHGGTAGTAAGRFYGVFTSTEVTPENDTKYDADLVAGRLVYFTSVIGYRFAVQHVNKTNYAITPRFVQDYGWTFSSNSIAFINCCWSDALGFTQTLRSLPKPCAITVGWSNAAHPEKAWRAARFLFDRLLGTNMAEPKETVNQRPFDIVAVYQDMQKRGFTDATTPFGPSQLIVTDGAGSPGGIQVSQNRILAPSIERMEVQERSLELPTLGESRLTIHGMFGSNPGTVTIDGTPVVKIISWSADKIVCQIADKPGPGFAGNVIVTAKNSVKSNAVPLTVWQGVFTYSGHPASAQLPTRSDIEFRVVFRADVHAYRKEPGGPLLKQKGVAFRAAATSVCSWEMKNGPLPGRTWVKYRDTLPYGLHGSAFPQYGKYGTGFIFEGTLNPELGTILLAVDFLNCVAVMQPPAPLPLEDLATPRDDLILARPLPPGTNGDTLFQPQVMGVLNENFSLGAGDVTGRMTDAFGTRLRWNAITPTHAPDSDRGEDQQ
jgi:hypothetical protein